MPEQRSAEKRQIEAELHEKLEIARIEYESASKDYQRALKHCDDLRRISDRNGNGNGNGTEPSVGPSTSEAVSSQHHAFEKYRRALADFNKYILYGDLPEWP